MIEYTALFILDGSTSDPVVLTRVLEAFVSTPELAPEYWGATERARQPYSTELIEQLAASEKVRYEPFYQSSVFLSRTKKLGYKALLSLTDASVADIKLWFKEPKSLAAVRRIYESVTELMEKLPLVYGGIHPVARKGEEVAELTFREAILCLKGVYATPKEIRAQGAPRPAARTLYGPLFVERMGVAALEHLGAKRVGENMLLDLFPEPWAATIPELFARQSVVLPQLKQTGMFAERELDENATVVHTAAGPSWVPPAWVLGLGDKRAKAKETKAE